MVLVRDRASVEYLSLLSRQLRGDLEQLRIGHNMIRASLDRIQAGQMEFHEDFKRTIAPGRFAVTVLPLVPTPSSLQKESGDPRSLDDSES